MLSVVMAMAVNWVLDRVSIVREAVGGAYFNPLLPNIISIFHSEVWFYLPGFPRGLEILKRFGKPKILFKTWKRSGISVIWAKGLELFHAAKIVGAFSRNPTFHAQVYIETKSFSTPWLVINSNDKLHVCRVANYHTFLRNLIRMVVLNRSWNFSSEKCGNPVSDWQANMLWLDRPCYLNTPNRISQEQYVVRYFQTFWWQVWTSWSTHFRSAISWEDSAASKNWRTCRRRPWSKPRQDRRLIERKRSTTW